MSDEQRNPRDDELFAGRGSPAYMSPKEPAIKALRERYSESFAITTGNTDELLHLFLIKVGLWALVWTFPLNRLGDLSDGVVPAALKVLEAALTGNDDDLLNKLDKSVEDAKKRIGKKARQFGVTM